MYDLVVVGGGPAGLTATIYAIRKRLNVLLISEDLDEVMQLSDRILVLLEGEVMGELTRDEFDVNTLGLLMSGVTSPA